MEKFSKTKDIYSLLNKKIKCLYCNREHFIPIRFVERDIKINQMPPLIEKIAKNKSVLLLCDEITYEVAGREIEKTFRKSKWICDVLALKPVNTERVHADERYFQQITSLSKDKDIILTIGAGSVTDMGKYVGNRIGVPVVSFPTAPSMNAYTSAVVAFMKKGLKVTIRANPPVVILIDKKIISGAPKELIKAGFADSLAKSYANADWKLSSVLAEDYFCPLPLKIVSQGEKEYINQGGELINGNKKILDALMDGLLKGGFSMVIAGTSSPASGGEHLISHYLDMEAGYRNIESFSFHGLQVGLGIIAVSKIYDRLQKMGKKEMQKRLNIYKNDSYEQNIRNVFKDRFDIVWNEFKKKQTVLEKLPVSLVKNWNKIKKEILPLIYPYEKIKGYLLNAECPTRFNEIGVNKKLAYETIMNARFIRERLTILDIADELGILEEIAEKTE